MTKLRITNVQQAWSPRAGLPLFEKGEPWNVASLGTQNPKSKKKKIPRKIPKYSQIDSDVIHASSKIANRHNSLEKTQNVLKCSILEHFLNWKSITRIELSTEMDSSYPRTILLPTPSRSGA
ncbi:hypothetical protein OUZ56_003748 [Daphnia magna]|uniref:Uncharacterized protein n=1 Tax=Daphnia magna TaxID=35525 RepID=A0ABR0A9M5_9CRUS|nr:hypothetical protein OUZ56_003748 [Daphnia magna]